MKNDSACSYTTDKTYLPTVTQYPISIFTHFQSLSKNILRKIEHILIGWAHSFSAIPVGYNPSIEFIAQSWHHRKSGRLLMQKEHRVASPVEQILLSNDEKLEWLARLSLCSYSSRISFAPFRKFTRADICQLLNSCGDNDFKGEKNVRKKSAILYQNLKNSLMMLNVKKGLRVCYKLPGCQIDLGLLG